MTVWEELEALRRQMDRTYQDLEGARWPRVWRTAFLPGTAARRYPLVNLHEDANNLYVEALAPGVDPKVLDLSVVQGRLTIKGEKVGLEYVTAEAYHRNERAAGQFNRTIDLPVHVDPAKVKADYTNGLLLITLPKSEEAKPRQIQVNVG